VCLSGCARDGDCRPGYVCGGSRFPDGCVTSCHTNFFCGNGSYCDASHCLASGGNRGIWQSCTSTECTGLCLLDTDFDAGAPAGFTAACVARCDSGEVCPGGSACVTDLGLCLKTCATDNDCALNAADACLTIGADDVCWYGA